MRIHLTTAIQTEFSKSRDRLTVSFLIVLLATCFSNSHAQSKTSALEIFLQKAELSDLTCSLPVMTGSVVGVASALDVETSALSSKEKERMLPVLREMKRLERLECARLHVCHLTASSLAVEAAQRSMAMKEQWRELTHRVLEDLKKQNLPIQAKQVEAELNNAESGVWRARIILEEAQASLLLEESTIQTILGSRDQSVRALIDEMRSLPPITQEEPAILLAMESRPDLRLRILMSQIFKTHEKDSLGGWARDAVKAEVIRAFRRVDLETESADAAVQALKAIRRTASAGPAAPNLEFLTGIPSDAGWLYIGFERGAIPVADLLWSLRNLTDLMSADSQARISLNAAIAAKSCATGEVLGSRLTH